jgi:hypothetical protein
METWTASLAALKLKSLEAAKKTAIQAENQ